MKNLLFKKFKIIILIITISTCFYACEEENPEIQETNVNNNNQSEKQEMAYPNKSGQLKEISIGDQVITVEEIDDDYIYQGDIIINKDSYLLNTKSTGRSLEKWRWPNNRVYYSIDDDLQKKSRVREAIANWESKTNIRFVQRTNQNDYIRFRTGNGCSSNVGRQGGLQNITLAEGCSTGNTIHEIGHALGLWHEQSRSDRDLYVNIKYKNIKEDKENNFDTYVQRNNDGEEFTKEFDFNSIMMYGPYAFSKNGKPTITKRNGKLYDVQRDVLSNGDLEGVFTMYPSVSPWLTGNRSGDSRGRKNINGLVTGISVREEGGYGVVNASLTNNQSSTPWTTTNTRGDLRTVKFTHSSEYATGIEVIEQDGYGIIDARLVGQYGSRTDWVTRNPSGSRTLYYFAPSGKYITGIEAQEQGNYGIVDIRVYLND